MLSFWGRLRRSSDDRRRYERTKRKPAAREWPDLNTYAEVKTEVIESSIAAAVAAGETSP
jgi:GrpB-like predicted nucleotidyltransferase (UPF0157 family)